MKACLPDLSFCNNPNFKKKIRGVPDPLRALAVRGPLLLVGLAGKLLLKSLAASAAALERLPPRQQQLAQWPAPLIVPP